MQCGLLVDTGWITYDCQKWQSRNGLAGWLLSAASALPTAAAKLRFAAGSVSQACVPVLRFAVGSVLLPRSTIVLRFEVGSALQAKIATMPRFAVGADDLVVHVGL